MEGEGGGAGGNIQKLPVECLSHAISLTSPRDASRSEAVSVAFRVAAASDVVWERFLPSDCGEILARAADPLEVVSKKHLYFLLCNSILIDGGRMSFALDRETGAKCFMLSARELVIIWGDTPHYWSWIRHPDSRFDEVAELLNVCWLEIRGKFDSRILSPKTNYAAYLIFKISVGSRGLGYPLQEVSLIVGSFVSKSSVRLHRDAKVFPPEGPFFHRRPFFRRGPFNLLRHANLPQESGALEEPPHDPHEPEPEPEPEPLVAEEAPPHDQHEDSQVQVGGVARKRHDGWMEVLLGEFYNEEGDDGDVIMSLMETKGGHWKSGLIVQGIEIRPK